MMNRTLIQLVIYVAVMSVGLYVGYSWRDNSAKVEVAALNTQIADSSARFAHALRSMEERHREIERTWSNRNLEALNAAHLKTLAAEADAQRARQSADRLQQRVKDLLGQLTPKAPAGSPASDAGPAADAAGDLLADMFRRIDEAAGGIGAYADKARIAGQTCERTYDAVTDPVPRLGGADEQP